MPPSSRKESVLMGAVGLLVFCVAAFKFLSQLKGNLFASNLRIGLQVRVLQIWCSLKTIKR